jgi:hypothetical protein
VKFSWLWLAKLLTALAGYEDREKEDTDCNKRSLLGKDGPYDVQKRAIGLEAKKKSTTFKVNSGAGV